MYKIELVGLFAIVLIVFSCSSLAGSSPLPLTSDGDLTYRQLANGMPFVFPTPTATPSLTPEPTVTPVPTPRPEPTARPTIELDCKSTAAAGNLKVQVTGTLTYNKTGLPGAAIYVGYSADCGNKWENFSLVQTHDDGGFETLWTPNATGYYLITAQWEGNLTLHWVNATANLALTPDSAGNEFSVASNSTISNLTYNSVAQELSFNTNGTLSTTGYAYVCLPKTLVSDIQTVEVKIDGKPATSTSEAQNDVWVISCVYTQSQHFLSIKLPLMQALSSATAPWITIVVILSILIALVAIAVVIRRRRRTAATVAAILKQNRPVN